MSRTQLIKLWFNFLYYTKLSSLLAMHTRGIGAVLMLHHIRPITTDSSFKPNHALEITPEFLEEAIRHIRQQGYDIISLQEAYGRITGEKESRKPIVVITIDDGYRDNFEFAFPIFHTLQCPFTIFVSTAVIDGTCELWWRVLERAIQNNETVHASTPEGTSSFKCKTDADKTNTFSELHKTVRDMDEKQQRTWIRKFGEVNGIDIDQLCRDEGMTWKQLRELSTSPLCTIGGHTVNHYSLKKLSEEDALEEITEGAGRLELELGNRPWAFAYPYGDKTSADEREFGIAAKNFDISFTTRSGVIENKHVASLSAVPRVSLNGGFQKTKYLDVLISGSAFRILNLVKTFVEGFKRVT